MKKEILKSTETNGRNQELEKITLKNVRMKQQQRRERKKKYDKQHNEDEKDRKLGRTGNRTTACSVVKIGQGFRPQC